jgi:hypothetical protein
MSTATTQSGIPIAVWNIVCAIGFIGCCIGGIVAGAMRFSTTHHWGMIALAACVGAIGVIGIIRQAVFSAQALDDGIIFFANFSSNSWPWTLAVIGLFILGAVLFFVSPPF